MRPLLLVVTGRPGSGKTTLAERLSREWYMPLVSRDRVKEGWVHTMLRGGAELPEAENLIATNIFFETVALLAERGVSLIAEAAFQHKLWAARLPALMEKADTRIVICTVEDSLALQRFLERGMGDPNRLRFHGDKGVRMLRNGVTPEPGPWVEPRLDAPTFHVQTADGYDPPIERVRELVFAGRE